MTVMVSVTPVSCEVTVMTAVPAATAVIRPEALTVALVASLDA